MSPSREFNIVANYFRSILDNVAYLEIFTQAPDFELCTRLDVGGKLIDIAKTHRAALNSIAAKDERFNRAVELYMKDLSHEDINLMESHVGYDWRYARDDSWPELTSRKLRRYESYCGL